MIDNSKLQTIDDLIEHGHNSEYTTYRCQILARYKDIIYADSFVYDRYRDLLLENSAQMQLSDEEQKMYLNRADFFCMDVYGNPDLYHIILYLNNCGELDFHPSVVRYLIPESVEDVLKVIMSKETSNIQKSRKKVMG